MSNIKGRLRRPKTSILCASVIQYLLLVSMCCLVSKISGGDPHILIIQFRIKMSHYAFQRTNQRVIEEGSTVYKEAAKAARKLLFRSTSASCSLHTKGKKFPCDAGFSQTSIPQIKFHNQDSEVSSLHAAMTKIQSTHLKVKLYIIKEVQIVQWCFGYFGDVL